MLRGVIFAIVCATTPMAKGAAKPNGTYSDAVLVGFTTVNAGASCSTDGIATARSTGAGTADVSGSSTSSCADVTQRNYTIQVGDNRFVVKPTFSKKGEAVGFATLGWGFVLAKAGVLNNVLPGTHVLVRTDDQGFHVKLGKRVSLYSVVTAQ